MSTSDDFSINTSKIFRIKKGFALLLVLIAVASGVVIIGAFVYFQLKTKAYSPASRNSASTVQTSPTPEILTVNKLAFFRSGKIWISNPDGNGQKEITEGSSPQWCPDGTKISFFRAKTPNTTGFIPQVYAEGGAPLENYYYDLGKEKVTQLTKTTSDGLIGDGKLTWAPDCNRYAYVTFDGKLTVGNIKTGQTKVILTGNGTNANPSWSPKGEKIQLTKPDAPLSSVIIIIINSDGANKKEIKVSDTDLSNAGINSSIWGDGLNEVIIEVANPAPTVGPTRAIDYRIYRMSLANPKDLKEIPATQHSGYAYTSPTLSPDGKLVTAFHRSKKADSTYETAFEISVLTTGGQILKEDITKGIASYISPGTSCCGTSWAPSSDRFVVVAGNSKGEAEVWVITTDGKQTKILDSVTNPIWSPI